jgi:hypothetical protein
MGHDHLLEIRLLEKSARHDFIIARHHSSNNYFSCQLLESSLSKLNRIRAVDKFCVKQLISCQKCRANDCRAIKFRAVDPHSLKFESHPTIGTKKKLKEQIAKSSDCPERFQLTQSSE